MTSCHHLKACRCDRPCLRCRRLRAVCGCCRRCIAFFKHVVGKPLRRTKDAAAFQANACGAASQSRRASGARRETLTALKARVKKNRRRCMVRWRQRCVDEPGSIRRADCAKPSDKGRLFFGGEPARRSYAQRRGRWALSAGDDVPSGGAAAVAVEPGARTSATAGRTLAQGEQYLTMPLIGLFIPRFGDVAARFVKTSMRLRQR